jgi:hypothetical protein
MASNADVIERWSEVVTGRATRHLKGRSVIADGNTVYSYGRHFPMAEAYRTRAGELWVLVNGDRYSVTTSGHQSMVRGQVARMGVPSIIVPFAALEAAGIIRSTIELLEVTPDANLEHHHQSRNLADVPKRERTYWTQDGADWHEVTVEPDADGFYRWTRYEHRLGEAVFSAEFRRRRESARRCLGPFDGQVTRVTRSWSRDDRTDQWARVCRHGMVREHRPQVIDQGRATCLSGFDHQEKPPLYFLAQLPREAVAA